MGGEEFLRRQREKSHAAYIRNRERESERKRAYRLARLDELKEAHQKWLMENPSYHREWYEKNKEIISANQKARNRKLRLDALSAYFVHTK